MEYAGRSGRHSPRNSFVELTVRKWSQRQASSALYNAVLRGPSSMPLLAKMASKIGGGCNRYPSKHRAFATIAPTPELSANLTLGLLPACPSSGHNPSTAGVSMRFPPHMAGLPQSIGSSKLFPCHGRRVRLAPVAHHLQQRPQGAS